MGAIFSLFLVLFISFCVIRTATAALTLTGLSRDLAWFQSISAFTGVGFTTAESEHMLSHPARRKVVTVLMIVGNVGIVMAASSLVLTFSEMDDTYEGLAYIIWLFVGVAALWAVLSNRAVDVRLHRMLREVVRRSGRIEVEDYVDLLHLTGEFSVTELLVSRGHWLVDRRLAESRLADEGVTILGIQRAGGEFLGVPRGETLIQDEDRLIVYARVEAIEALTERRRDAEGDAKHREAVGAVRHVRAEQVWHDRHLRADSHVAAAGQGMAAMGDEVDLSEFEVYPPPPPSKRESDS